MGWIKRVLDAVNPYEARIRDFTGDIRPRCPACCSSSAPLEGPVALNPDKNVIENVGLIELYETILQRGRDLSIDLSTPVSTPAIANALQLASTRLSDFYTLLGNDAYTDAKDPTIGIGSSSVEFGYGSFASVVFSLPEPAGVVDRGGTVAAARRGRQLRPARSTTACSGTSPRARARPPTRMNYNITDINADGFMMRTMPCLVSPGPRRCLGPLPDRAAQAVRPAAPSVLQLGVALRVLQPAGHRLKVDFLDERKFAQVAAAKARVARRSSTSTYREHYVEDPTAQWQGYTDVNPDRAWGVQEWARRAGQGAYFDWVTANALLPAQHPNETLEGIQKVDREVNDDIKVVSANLNLIQQTLDDANRGLNPLRLSAQAVPFDINAFMLCTT
jgi:hypothetical protein